MPFICNTTHYLKKKLEEKKKSLTGIITRIWHISNVRKRLVLGIGRQLRIRSQNRTRKMVEEGGGGGGYTNNTIFRTWNHYTDESSLYKAVCENSERLWKHFPLTPSSLFSPPHGLPTKSKFAKTSAWMPSCLHIMQSHDFLKTQLHKSLCVETQTRGE